MAGAAAADVVGRCCRAETAGDDRFWGLPQHQGRTRVGAETLPLLSETANVNVLSLFEDTSHKAWHFAKPVINRTLWSVH